MLTWINKQKLEEWQVGMIEVISAHHESVGKMNEAVELMNTRLENFKNIVELQNKRIDLLEETLSNVTKISVHDSLLGGSTQQP